MNANQIADSSMSPVESASQNGGKQGTESKANKKPKEVPLPSRISNRIAEKRRTPTAFLATIAAKSAKPAQTDDDSPPKLAAQGQRALPENGIFKVPASRPQFEAARSSPDAMKQELEEEEESEQVDAVGPDLMDEDSIAAQHIESETADAEDGNEELEQEQFEDGNEPFDDFETDVARTGSDVMSLLAQAADSSETKAPAAAKPKKKPGGRTRKPLNPEYIASKMTAEAGQVQGENAENSARGLGTVPQAEGLCIQEPIR
jgi:hypothetical protein